MERTEDAAQRLSRLAAGVMQMILQLPPEVKSLPVGELIDEVWAAARKEASDDPAPLTMEAATTCSPQVRDASTLTDENARTTSQAHLLQCGRIQERGTLTESFDIRSIIEKRVSNLWGLFARLHFQRLYWHFRLRFCMRREYASPLTHARAVMSAYKPLKGVLEEQIATIDAVKRIAAAPEHEHCGASFHTYQKYLSSRQTHLRNVLAETFDVIFHFIRESVRGLELAPQKPDLSMFTEVGRRLIQKEESVRRLQKRKPWLFAASAEFPSQEEQPSTVRQPPEERSQPHQLATPQPNVPQSGGCDHRSPRKPRGRVANTTTDTAMYPKSRMEELSILPTVRATATSSPPRETHHSPRANFLCDACMRAKQEHRAMPQCRTSGCVVATLWDSARAGFSGQQTKHNNYPS